MRDPELDAEWLLRSVLGCDRAALISGSRRPLAEADARAFEELVERRRSGLPVQHLTGVQEFWRHSFRVGPGALIPRPETEGLVEAALERLAARRAPLLADVGTGSGCIALSLAAELPDARVHATDRSPAALRVAAENRRLMQLEDRVALHQGDLLRPLAGLGAVLDAVVCNPPYIDRSEAAALAVEVREHEPALALFAPGDRYAVYRRLLPQARRLLRVDGWLLLEVGAGMHDEVARLARGAGFGAIELRPDLQGIQRVVIASAGAAP